MGGAATIYSYAGTNILIGTKTFTVAGDAKDNLKVSIQNPIPIIKGSGVITDWYSTVDGETEANRWNNEDGAKSVFDPCPEGWRVPTSGEGDLSPWYGLTTTNTAWNSASSYNDRTSDDLGFFPASGSYSYAGMVSAVESQVNVWTAIQGADGRGRRLNMTDSSVSPSASIANGTAMPVRCVKVE